MSVSAWAEIWDSTLPSTPVDPSDLAPTRDTLTITSPRPTTEQRGAGRSSWTHSDVPYEFLCGVYGGKPPFTFAISGIADATIEAKAPPRNPSMTSWGIIRIPAGIEGTYTVTVTDQDDAVDTVTVNVVKDDSRFIFVDSTTGLDPTDRNGSFSNPFKDFTDLKFDDREDTTFVGKILVFLDAGPHYLVPNTLRQTLPTCEMAGSTKPVNWLGIPGVRAKIDGTNCQGFFRQDWGFSGSWWDASFNNMEWQNSQIGLYTVGSTARTAFWDLWIHDMQHDTITEDYNQATDRSNIAGIALIGSGTETGNHTYRALADIGFWNMTKNTPKHSNHAAILTYANWYTSYDYIYHKGISEGGGVFNWGTILFRKNAFKSTATSIFAWFDGYSPSRGNLFDLASFKTERLVKMPAGITNDDVRSQLRYSLVGGSNTNESGMSISYTQTSYADDKYKLEGKRWADRCTLYGADVKFPARRSDYVDYEIGMGAYYTKVIQVGTEGWWTSSRSWWSETIFDDTETVRLRSIDDLSPYIDTQGNTVGLNKYKIGWEVK